MNRKTHEKTLQYRKDNAEEDYRKAPISVLKYITILEEELNQGKTLPVADISRSFCDEFNYPLNEVQRHWLRRLATVLLSLIVMPVGAFMGLREYTSEWYEDCW